MNIKKYIERINYHGTRHPSIETLRQLQLAHLLTVPFENLSVYYKEAIVLQDEALFNKIVTRRRGGFCYELNGLFAALLRALGFQVEMLAAGVVRPNGGFGPAFDHLMLMVSLDERWLVDVGFGDSFREPLRLDDRGVQPQNERAYQLVADGESLILMEQKKNEDASTLRHASSQATTGGHRACRDAERLWKAQYRFDLQTYQLLNYENMCHYHQTSPESSFTKGRVCTRATADGRVTLRKMRLITTTLKGERQEREVADEEEYAFLLAKHFGIIMG